MKLFVILIAGVLIVSGCRITDRSDREVGADLINNPRSEFSVDPEKMPVISFEDPVFSFGLISEGEVIDHTFTFKNTGKSPLIISHIEGSCGCTVMRDWPKEPVEPGESGEISVEYNSKNKGGKQNVAIRVLANTSPATTVLTMEGEIASVKQ